MVSQSTIQYIKGADIDKKKWDTCIKNSQNGLIYGYSFYLDHMAKHWDGLVLEDYKAVMPLTWNRKWGINYLYQPPFTQQLGIFSSLDIDEVLVKKFLAAIPTHFRFAEIFLNYKNSFRGTDAQRINLVLALNESFDRIKTKFRKSLLQSVERSKRYNLQYLPSENYLEAIEYFRVLYGNKLPHLTTDDYSRFSSLCEYLKLNHQLLTREIVDPGGKLLSITLFLKDQYRFYNIISATTEEGRKREAAHFLFYEFIKEFSGSGMTLDIEGSDIKGIYAFYKKFSPVLEPYFFVRINQLPFPLRLLKPASTI
jgi:hypothetical protein